MPSCGLLQSDALVTMRWATDIVNSSTSITEDPWPAAAFAAISPRNGPRKNKFHVAISYSESHSCKQLKTQSAELTLRALGGPRVPKTLRRVAGI